MPNNCDTLIIGAGAAGLMAAIQCAQRGQSVTLLEKMDRPGRKLLITGKGRCNVTNCCTIEEFMPNVLSNPRFLYSCLNALNPYEVMGFFEECGVPLKVERGERVFPVSDRSADIVQALVDKAQGNPLTQRIRGVRQVISDGNGVLLPEIRIRENFRLKPSQYAIFINGIKADEADIPADKLMALPSSETYGEIDGVQGNDPAYGMPVTWIQAAQKAKALNMGYQVIDSASVIATHVNKIVRSYIPDLFNYDDITQLHNRLSSMAPRLAEDLSAALNYSQLLKVYRTLLTEGVSLRDIVTIATVLVASSAVTKDHILLAADVRLALRRSITHPFVRKQELTVYTLNNELENLLTNVVNQAQQGGKVMLDSVPVDPNMLNQFQSTMPQVKEQMKAAGKDPVLLVPPQLRPLLARYARLFAPGLHVLSYNEVPDELELKIMGALM